jgi:hypothetical protein
MARSSLASPAVVDLLRPFVVTATHCGTDDLADLEPTVREVFTRSDLSKDPNRLNVFMFVLDPQGRVVHEFHGLPGGRRSVVPGRSDHQAEIQKARAKLELPEVEAQSSDGALKGIPDLKAVNSGAPAGVRLFIRQDEPGNSVFSTLPAVEVVPMNADDWKPLAFTPNVTEIEAEVLKRWLVWVYPAGIRAADEQKRFQKFSGALKLESAGSNDRFRYAILRGKIRLTKGNDRESAFEGELEAVLTYRHDPGQVQSLRGVVEGTYLYRTRETSREILRVAIESRPE